MNDFYRTQMGRTFYESHVPKLIKALERIAVALEKNKEQIGIWECTECGGRTEVSYEDAIVIGTPFCSTCNKKHGRLEQMQFLTMKQKENKT